MVDARGKAMWAIGLLLASLVAFLELGGAAIVAVVLQLASSTGDASVQIPLVGDVRDLLPGTDKSADLRFMAVVGTLFFVVRGMAVLFQQYFVFRTTYSLAVRLTDAVTEQLLARDYRWHLSQNSAELSALALPVTQTFALRVFAPIQQVGSQGLVILALAAVAIAIEPVGAIATVVGLGLVVTVTLRLTRRQLLPLGEIELAETALGQQLTTEAFQTIREIKVLGLQASAISSIHRSRQRWGVAMRRSATIVAAPRTVIETVAFAALITLLAYRSGTDALSGIGVLGYAVVRILPSANNVITHLNTARGSQASMHRLATLLGHRPAEHVARPGASGSLTPPIVARNVRFAYSEDGADVVQNVNLTIGVGESIGIVGRTGCGKSTLLDLISGLLDPTEGEIAVSGRPIADVRAEWWSSIGIVPQKINLLDTTLEQNIALGLELADVDRASLERAIRLAQMEEVIARLPDGLQTVVGEQGVRFSGGQRQRLAIARALYRNPPTLVLDEATSALDTATESAVIAALRADRPDRTLVMVAHRISTLRDCDLIVVMDSGRITATGTHDELLAASTTFRELVSADG